MECKKGPLVHRVLAGSIADRIGIRKGDCVLFVNGKKIEDIFDYRFFTTENKLSLRIQREDGEIREYSIRKEEYEDLGMEFADSLFNGAMRCANKCIFCFIDQLPAGMRKTLYFKDDDIRLSFLLGNYVTLTNLSDKGLKRIINYRMSPINVSVHATNPALRSFMLGNKSAGNVLDKIQKMINAGIQVNCQVVLCRGINDGKELDNTIKDLSELYPGINSISIVPVGITRYREHLYKLEPYDKKAALEVLSQVEAWQDRLLETRGSRVVFLADEFYILAGRELPGYDEYEDFCQLENGVGLVSLFKYEFLKHLSGTGCQNMDGIYDVQGMDGIGEKDGTSNHLPRVVSVATGVLAGKFIKGLACELEKIYNNVKINVYPIKNEFFGEYVTVAGLITGQDIVKELSGKDLGCELLIPATMLKSGSRVFLDGYTVKQVESMLGTRVRVVEAGGKPFIEAALGICNDAEMYE